MVAYALTASNTGKTRLSSPMAAAFTESRAIRTARSSLSLFTFVNRCTCLASISGSILKPRTGFPIRSIFVDTDHHPLPLIELALSSDGAVIDFSVVVSLLDGCDGTPISSTFRYSAWIRFSMSLVRLSINRIRPEVDRMGDAEFMGEDLLGPYRNLGRIFRRCSQHFVVGSIVEELNASQHIGQCSHRNPYDVVDRLEQGLPPCEYAVILSAIDSKASA